MGYRTSRMVIRRGGKHKALYRVIQANMAHAAAVYNKTLFHIRNLFTGLNKDEFHRTENERMVINAVRTAIDDINRKRITKGREPFAYPTPEMPYLGDYLWLSVMNRILKDCLPRPESFYSKLEQQTVRQCCRAMKSFRQAIADWKVHPDKYLGRPALPGYIRSGTFTLDYDCQMVRPGGNGNRHTLRLAGVGPVLKTGRKQYTDIVSIRLAFRHGDIVASICMKENPAAENTAAPDAAAQPDPGRMIGIDPGVNNFLAVCPGFGRAPILVRGGRLKAMNQYYNKQKAFLQANLKKAEDRYSSRRLDKLDADRENFLYNYFHQTARSIVDYALRERAGTIVIGRNIGWKQRSSMGKLSNQKFTYIPHQRFFRILEDKAKRSGILVAYTEESYTSLASARDRDVIPVYGKTTQDEQPRFSGRRIRRGLYISADGTKVNADVNGAANIIRKYCEEGLQADLDYLAGPVYVLNVA